GRPRSGAARRSLELHRRGSSDRYSLPAAARKQSRAADRGLGSLGGRMRRILLLSAPLALRGTSLYTVSLARELKLLGHKVAVLGPGGTLEGLLAEQDIEQIRAPVRGRVLGDLLYLNVFVDVARDFDPEVVHVQSHSLALVGMLL